MNTGLLVPNVIWLIRSRCSYEQNVIWSRSKREPHLRRWGYELFIFNRNSSHCVRLSNKHSVFLPIREGQHRVNTVTCPHFNQQFLCYITGKRAWPTWRSATIPLKIIKTICGQQGGHAPRPKNERTSPLPSMCVTRPL